MNSSEPVVLILGAGINGCALARELALNGVATWLVDRADLASGATSGSSRLIHGGLRYLEYGELDLVKESLAERTRLLRLAPQFVAPLRLWVPAPSRFGGAIAAIGRFFGWKRWPQPKRPRGSELIRAGLIFYDAYAHDPTLPKHHCQRVAAPGGPPVNPEKYRRECSYYDGQVAFPERLVISMLDDAQRLSREQRLGFEVFNHCRVERAGDKRFRIVSVDSPSTTAVDVEPAVVVNATGSWVDATLEEVQVRSERLMGGTKGSHFFTFNPRLLAQLDQGGIYAEADDGRPIFILPVATTAGQWALVGTTDLPFSDPPETAVATPAELEYLLHTVNTVLPAARLTRDDIDFHYSAIRPLPFVHAKTTAAITRRHFLVEHDAPFPFLSIVGGKLTTMRSLAEEAAAAVLKHLQRTPRSNSRERPFPGAESYPADRAQVSQAIDALARQSGFSRDSVAAVWALCGTRAASILNGQANRELLRGTNLPLVFVQHAIDQEHARTLDDLVERRLMLLYHQRLRRSTLVHLAECLVESGRLAPDGVERSVTAETQRLARHFGKHLV